MMNARRLHSWRIDLLAALAGGSLIVATACATAASQSSRSAPPSGPAIPSGPQMWLKQRGELVAFPNDGAVQVDGLELEVAVAPYPPSRASDVDLRLTRDGAPVDGATVRLR